GMASAAGSASDTSFLGSATVWPLKRYGRFLPPKDGDDQGPSSSWKVFESNEESGPLVLTIVESGHFFISQERTVLNECRMFRVQFGGSSKEQMQEHCCSCVHKLSAYVPVQGEPIPPCPGIPGPCPKSLSSSLGRKAHIQKSQLIAFQEQQTQAAPCFSSMQEGWGVAVSDQGHLPTFHWQWALRQRPELPPALWQPAWSARELGLFIRLCLMDQHFPAFVEDVERELHRLAEE
uniref:REC114 meiotic recombination protein n=1 Tax=Catharus ustulatus TaxID=91951 RepID=A0A8C3UI63_CATUS